MTTNLIGTKDPSLLDNQKLHQSRGDFDQKPNQQTSIPNSVRPFSAPKMAKEQYHFRYMNPTDVNNYQRGHQYSAPKRVITPRRIEHSPISASHITNEQIIKGDSSIKYIPYETKIVQYENRSYVQKVPVKKKVVKYEEKKFIEAVPHQIVKQDYYAIQTKVQYLKEIIPQKIIEMVPIQRKIKRYDYLPVERKIVHYPSNYNIETTYRQPKTLISSYDPFGTIDRINTNMIFTYSTRPGIRDNHLNSIDQRPSRLISKNMIPMSSNVKSKQADDPKDDNDQHSLISPLKAIAQSKTKPDKLNPKEKQGGQVPTFNNLKNELDSKYGLNKAESVTDYMKGSKQVGDSIIVDEDEKKGDKK